MQRTAVQGTQTSQRSKPRFFMNWGISKTLMKSIQSRRAPLRWVIWSNQSHVTYAFCQRPYARKLRNPICPPIWRKAKRHKSMRIIRSNVNFNDYHARNHQSSSRPEARRRERLVFSRALLHPPRSNRRSFRFKR